LERVLPGWEHPLHPGVVAGALTIEFPVGVELEDPTARMEYPAELGERSGGVATYSPRLQTATSNDSSGSALRPVAGRAGLRATRTGDDEAMKMTATSACSGAVSPGPRGGRAGIRMHE